MASASASSARALNPTVGHAGEHLDGVEAAHLRALARELAGHVHQAAEVAAEQQLRAAALDRGGLVAHDGVRDRRVLDAERAAEAAAHVVAFEGLQLEPGDGAEQRARLVVHAELAQPRAAVVVRGAGVEPAPLRPVAHHVDEEARDLPSAFGHALRALGPRRVVGERFGVVRAHHADARARRRDDVVEALEGAHEVARDGGGVLRVAAVERGLPAAGLRRRHLDAAAGLAQQLQRREAHARAHRVDEAGDEQGDARVRRRFGGGRRRHVQLGRDHVGL